MTRYTTTNANLNSAAYRLAQTPRRDPMEIALDNWAYFFEQGRWTRAREQWAEVQRLMQRGS